MPRKILVVDDNAINRQMLINVLQKDYDLLEAENGKEALALMRRNYKMLSAVLLDIMMPEMDGYDVLRHVRENPLLSQIPVIMVTGSEDEQARVRSLSLGANDFISKPFNPDIVRHCLRNNIALRETASILNAIQKDKLTGLYNREAFFEKVGSAIKDRDSGAYILSCFDIDNFKLINDQYGASEGDRILKEIGRTVKPDIDAMGGIAGRISADNFAVLFPADKSDTGILKKMRGNRLGIYDQRAVVFSVGRYLITDLSLPASALYDRAYIAKQSVKGRYDEHMAYFDEDMLQKLIRDQQIVGDMEQALSRRQFELWFQPQYNHVSGALTGAEALVRWNHPVKGIIPPGEFIPLFEQNGFVYELDKYVWRETCRYLRKWLDEGLSPLPVSVNISRYDIFRTDLIEVITGIIEEFDVPIDLLRLEITESAFARSTRLIVDIVKKLIYYGFTIEIDDFGSGYSSLNTLKSVPAQVVKLDMRFLEDGDDVQRGGNILESIVRMTKWLGMSVIAEGVETKEQGDFLKSIGCSHVQGYLYAQPMPAKEYEKHFKCAQKGDDRHSLETAAAFNNSMFWNPRSIDSLIFNSFVGSACIFEYHNGELELLRATDKYAQMLNMTVDQLLKLDLMEYTDKTSSKALLEKVDQAVCEKGEVTGELLFIGLPNCPRELYIRAVMRVVASAEERYLVYCISENITAQRLAERKERMLTRQLRAIMDNINCGITAVRESGEKREYLLANDKYYELLGYTREQHKEELGDDYFKVIYPQDRQRAREQLRHTTATGEPGSMEYRVRRRDGSVVWLRSFISMTAAADGDGQVRLCTYADISAERRPAPDRPAQDRLSVSEMLAAALSKVMEASSELSFVKDGELRYVCCSRAFAQMIGLNSEKDVVGKTDHQLFPPQLAARYEEDDRRLMANGESIIDLVESLPPEGGKSRYSSTSKYLLYDPAGNVVGLYGTGRDITRARELESRQDFLLNNIPGGVAIYEGTWSTLESIRLSFFSDGFCRLFGYTREEYEKLGGSNPTGLVSGEYIPGLVKQIEALVRDGTALDYIYRAKVNGGGFRWIHIKAVQGERHGDNMTVNAVLFDITEHQEALERLRVSEEENRLAIRHSGNVVCRYDVAEQALSISSAANPIFGMSAREEDVPYGPLREGKVSPDTADAYIELYEGIRRGEKNGSAVYQRLSASGWRWLEAQYSTIFSSEGLPVSAVLSFRDVTESFEKEVAYKKWRQSLRKKASSSYSLFRCNLTRRSLTEAVEGTLIQVEFEPDVLSFDRQVLDYASKHVFPGDRRSVSSFLNSGSLLEKYFRGERVVSLDFRELVPSAAFRWLRLTVDLVEYPHSTDVEAYLLFEDIDEAKRAELLTNERAETDSLTGVYNRATFASKVDEYIAASGPGARHALLMLDVDGFKLVNDVFGHAAGDRALVDLAAMLRSISRRDDLVGRLGGDEFVVFLRDISGERIAANKAQRICQLSRKSYSDEVRISASVGIAVSPEDGAGFDQLYKRADEALYHVKGSGRDSFALYRDSLSGAPRPSVEPAAGRMGKMSGNKRRMLIVDDNKLDNVLLSNMFREEYTVERAKDGASALVRLRHYGSAISVVLLDLMMPGMDGFAVLEQMQQTPGLRSIPVVVVSGADDRETSLRAIRAGATDYVMKPVDADVLRIRVHAAISKADNERLRAKNSVLELQNAESALYNSLLDKLGLAVAELDWGTGTFTYSASMSEYLAGRYDGRSLWHILMTDLVAADMQTVKQLQELVHSVADDRGLTEGSAAARLKAPSGKLQDFTVNVYKLINEYGLADKMILTFKAR